MAILTSAGAAGGIFASEVAAFLLQRTSRDQQQTSLDV
jgi:hypothetical protein